MKELNNLIHSGNIKLPYYYLFLTKLTDKDRFFTPLVTCKFHKTSHYPIYPFYKPISKIV